MKNPFTTIKAAFAKIAGRKDQINKPQDELDKERTTIEIPKHRTHRRMRNHMAHKRQDMLRRKRQVRNRIQKASRRINRYGAYSKKAA